MNFETRYNPKTYIKRHKARYHKIAKGGADQPNLQMESQRIEHFVQQYQTTVTQIGFPVNLDLSTSILLIMPCPIPEPIWSRANYKQYKWDGVRLKMKLTTVTIPLAIHEPEKACSRYA
jgi:hypothetical protein